MHVFSALAPVALLCRRWSHDPTLLTTWYPLVFDAPIFVFVDFRAKADVRDSPRENVACTDTSPAARSRYIPLLLESCQRGWRPVSVDRFVAGNVACATYASVFSPTPPCASFPNSSCNITPGSLSCQCRACSPFAFDFDPPETARRPTSSDRPNRVVMSVFAMVEIFVDFFVSW